MGVGGLRPGTAHCTGEHDRLRVLPRAGRGTGQLGMGRRTVCGYPAAREEAAQRCLYRLFVVRLFGTWGAHGKHNTGAPRAAATGTAKLRQGRGTPRPPLLPPTAARPASPWPGRSPLPKGHPGGSLRGPGNPGPPLHLRRRQHGAGPRGAIPFPSPCGGSPGWLGWKRGVSSGGEGARAGAGAGGAPGRGSVGVVGHVEGLPGGPRVVPAALVLAQCRQPIHLWGKKMSVALVGYGPWGPPAHGDTALGVPQPTGTCPSACPIPHGHCCPPALLTQPSAPHSPGDITLSTPHPKGHRHWHAPLPQGHSPWCPHHPTGTQPSMSPAPYGT